MGRKSPKCSKRAAMPLDSLSLLLLAPVSWILPARCQMLLHVAMPEFERYLPPACFLQQ